MAQDPLKVDQLQIEPNADGTRMIYRAGDGSLQFKDAIIPGGLTLKQLAGLRNIANLLVVGMSGAGAAYTTLQAALDAIPIGASAINPYFVLVGPGVYNETINIVRDGVTIMGFGATINAVELVADGPAAYHTVVIQAALGSIPRQVTLIDLEIGNIHLNYACLRIFGAAASNVGSTGIKLINCTLRATSAGGNRPIWATSVNHISMEGGNMACATTALILIEECASFQLKGVTDSSALQLDWDSTGTLPSQAAVGYVLDSCTDLGYSTAVIPTVSSTLSGGSTLTISNCTGRPTVSLDGNRTSRVIGSNLGTIAVAGSTDLRLTGSSHSTVTAGGTATLEEATQRGSVALVGDITKAVVFGTPHPDANYTVSLMTDARPASDDIMWVTAKTAAGFTINFINAQTLGVSWTVVREMRS